MALGTLLAWLSGIAPGAGSPGATVGFYLPLPVAGDLFEALAGGGWVAYIGVILPMSYNFV